MRCSAQVCHGFRHWQSHLCDLLLTLQNEHWMLLKLVPLVRFLLAVFLTVPEMWQAMWKAGCGLCAWSRAAWSRSCLAQASLVFIATRSCFGWTRWARSSQGMVPLIRSCFASVLRLPVWLSLMLIAVELLVSKARNSSMALCFLWWRQRYANMQGMCLLIP